jgi:mannonate dehydratase
MKIKSVEAIPTCPGRNFSIVKIVTDNNLVGWGDATLNGRELSVVECINQHLAPLLIGEDARQIEHLWQALFVGAYWRGGPVLNSALAGIDMALWDLLGKHAGLPVYQLLGGRTRDGAACYSHAAGSTPEKLADEVRKKTAMGYRVVRSQLVATEGTNYSEKVIQRPDAADGGHLPAVGEWEPTPYMRVIPKCFAFLRQQLGDEIELLFDVHQRLTPIQAAGLARELEPYHLFFYEDPVAPEYASGLALIRQHSAIPIAIGELFTDIATCVAPITNRWLDYLRCDLGHVGGITAGRKLAALAEPFAIKTAWHGPPDLSPIGHAANVHLDIATSNFGIQEWTDFTLYPWAAKVADVFKGGVTRNEWLLDVSDAPGLGIEVDEAAARRYPYRREYLPVVRRRDRSVHTW